MATQTASQEYPSIASAHRAALQAMIDEAGIASLVRSFVRVCTSRAQTAKAAGDPAMASGWWKLSEQLSNSTLLAALSVEEKSGISPPGKLHDPGEIKIDAYFESNGEKP